MLRECTITILILRCHLISLSLMMVKNRPPSWWVIRVPLPHGRGCGTGTCSVAKLSEKRQIRFKMSTFNISTSKKLEWPVPGAKTWKNETPKRCAQVPGLNYGYERRHQEPLHAYVGETAPREGNVDNNASGRVSVKPWPMY